MKTAEANEGWQEIVIIANWSVKFGGRFNFLSSWVSSDDCLNLREI